MGKHILITGASSGVGKSLAKIFAQNNYNLSITARNLEKLELLKDELEQYNVEIFCLKCDVTNKVEVKETYSKIVSQVGIPDISILNAGIGQEMNAENFDSEVAEKIISTNLLGVIYFVEQLLPDLIKRNSGLIAGLSSLGDSRGFSGSGLYCASKSALTTFLEGLRADLSSYDLQVTTIRPGFIRTPMTDKNKFQMPFLMEPEVAAEIIYKGIIKGKNYIEFPFPLYFLTRLIGHLPNFLFDFLAAKAKK